MNPNFEHPTIDWGAADLYKEFTRFRDHVSFVFDGPLATADKKQKAGWLGTWIGSQGREIFRTLDWKEKEKEDPEQVLKKFETYVRPRKNKRIARYNLQRRTQKQEESFDHFLTNLKITIMDCDYTDPDDILIDCIINGVSDRKVQERLLDRGESLTLPKAIEICQQYEASQKQVKIVRGQEEDTLLEATPVHELKPKATTHRPRYSPGRPGSSINHPNTGCRWCGTDHSRSKGKCPASGTTCSYCKKENHWARVCIKRQKDMKCIQVQEGDSDESDQDTSVMIIYSMDQSDNKQNGPRSTDSLKTVKEDRWSQELKAHQKAMRFKIDTGARCNTMTLDSYNKIADKSTLYKSKRVLKTYSNHLIKPVGTIQIQIEHEGTKIRETFEVVDLQQENIISGATAERLGLIIRLQAVDNASHSQKLQDEFPELKSTTGTLPGEYQIKLRPDAQGVIHPPRRQPAALKDKIIEKLHEMESSGHIARVEQPTEWVNSMTTAVRNGKVRICLDPRDLNKAICREHYPMKTIEEISADIPNSTIFSTLDASNGFLQIKLDQPSSMLTTFNTPIGRYRWLRLPFGISCAPEVFQRAMDHMLEGISGAYAIIDDILIVAKTVEEHDIILNKVMERATAHNLQLNLDKTQLRQTEVSYVGHILTKDGLKPDPAKVQAVNDMPKPKGKEDIRRFLGFITYLGKFIPNLSSETQPLRQLLKEDVEFSWDDSQEQAFTRLKTLCSQCPVLRYFDVSRPVEIQSDASSKGLGAVLLQEGQPVAYASRALTDAEERYAQIEKEMLSIVFACRKFHCFIFGKPTTVINDHKPLEIIFKKPLNSAPMRLQRMLLSLQWYDLDVCYRKGKEMQLPDTLSRAFLPGDHPESDNEIDIKSFISISDEKYCELQQKTEEELGELRQSVISGWPADRPGISQSLHPYWDSRAELTIVDGIIMKGPRLVIPPSMRKYMLKLTHGTHLGVVKCKQRAREVIYWPGMNSDIENTIRNCSHCAEVQNRQAKQPLNPSLHPTLPFKEIAVDIFELNGEHFLITVDYYSKFIMVNKLGNLRSSTVIEILTQIISVHGIPTSIRSDCGTQFTSAEFQTFCRKLDIKHTTVSPHYQRSNGLAEKGVQTIKRLWRKGGDRYLSVLDYNSTPLEGFGVSPAQLLMGRRPRNLLPATDNVLKPKHVDPSIVQAQAAVEKTKQKFYHDRYATVPLGPLHPTQQVRMVPTPGQKQWTPATVVRKHESPRSYVVNAGGTLYRRNRQHLRLSTKEANRPRYRAENASGMLEDAEGEEESDNSRRISSESEARESEGDTQPPFTPPKTPYTTRSGRTIRARPRLDL